jgi:hypothetical protein
VEGGYLVELSATDPEVWGSNPAAVLQREKKSKKDSDVEYVGTTNIKPLGPGI